MRRTVLAALIAAALAGPLLAPTPAGAGDGDGTAGVTAQFEGRTIDLAESWQGARACNSDGVDTVCFRTVTAAQVALAKQAFAPEASCASALQLFSGASYTGLVITLSQRAVWINLSGYGFDSITSSYKVGACSVTMKDGVGGTGSTYPGSTAAFTNSPSMSAGWDNRIRSLFIN